MALTRKNFKKINTLVGISCLAGAIIFSACSFITSLVEYAQYESEYNNAQKEIFAKTPTAPKEVLIDNEYITYAEDGVTIESSKSNYPYKFTCLGSEATFSSNPNGTTYAKVEVNDYTSSYASNVCNIGNSGGGSLEFNFDVEYGCYADIDLVASSAFYSPEVNGNIATEELTKWIKLTINNITIDADHITLPVRDTSDFFNFQHVILKDVHLKTGNNVLKLETQMAHPFHLNEYVFPNVNRIHVLAEQPFSGQRLSVNAESAFISKEKGIFYFNFSGTAINYNKEQLMIDLCLANETYNKIDKSKLYLEIVDNRYVIKLPLETLGKGNYYPHFYIDGEAFNAGHKDGRILVNNMNGYYSGTVAFQSLENYQLSFVNKQLRLTVN